MHVTDLHLKKVALDLHKFCADNDWLVSLPVASVTEQISVEVGTSVEMTAELAARLTVALLVEDIRVYPSIMETSNGWIRLYDARSPLLDLVDAMQFSELDKDGEMFNSALKRFGVDE